MHNARNPVGVASPEKNATAPIMLNEAQAAALLGIGRRKFHDVRQQPWFAAVCTAIVLGPRALRWDRSELIAAAKAAPRRTVLAEPQALAAARDRRAVAEVHDV